MDQATTRSADFSFLEGNFVGVKVAARAVNLFEIAGFPRWETVASNVLAYFLDPNERHGLGSAFVDGLMRAADGARFVGSSGGTDDELLHSSDFEGSEEWAVRTEFVTHDRNRIDVYLTNRALDFAVVIENKLDADVYNPFDSYVARAASEYTSVLCVVLAPRKRAISDADSHLVSCALTYDELFDQVLQILPIHEHTIESRSAALLEQFIENLSERAQKMDNSRDAATLETYWSAIDGRGAEIEAYFRAIGRVNEILRARANVLQSAILQQPAFVALVRNHWTVLGFDKKWGRADGRVTCAYVCFELTDGNCIELLLGDHPQGHWRGLAVKAYPKASGAGAMFSDFRHKPLGLPWATPDDELVDAFLAEVGNLRASHPGARSA